MHLDLASPLRCARLIFPPSLGFVGRCFLEGCCTLLTFSVIFGPCSGLFFSCFLVLPINLHLEPSTITVMRPLMLQRRICSIFLLLLSVSSSDTPRPARLSFGGRLSNLVAHTAAYDGRAFVFFCRCFFRPANPPPPPAHVLRAGGGLGTLSG